MDSVLRSGVDAPSGAARRAMTAAALGWGLDGFDFYLYVYALPAIMATFALSKAAAGLLATETLAASAVGGIAMGAIADRIGRKRALMISVAWYALFTALCGCAQSYAELSVLRTLEGFGFGGEWAVGAVLAAEWSSSAHRGRNLGLMQSAWALGWLAANGAFSIVASTVGAPYEWRVLFALGILPAIALLYMRRAVDDAPSFRAAPPNALGPLEIFRNGLGRTTLLATLLAIGAQSGYYALFTWLPSYLSSARGLPPVSAGAYLYAVIGGAFAGYVSAGYINDALGRRASFVLFALASAGMVPLYLAYVSARWELVPAGALLGFCASGIFSGFGPFLSELFPGDVRASAQAFCYNVGRGVAGAAPFLVGLVAAHVSIGRAMIFVAVAAYGLAVVAALALPETKGRRLDAANR
jgi:MFS family permease